MSMLFQDVRFAIRTLLKQPGYSFIVILMLALGIAANAAIFTLFNGLFLRPLPFPDPQRIVNLDERAPLWELEYTGANYTDFHYWREENTTFDGMALWGGAAFNLSLGDEAERVSGAIVTHDVAEVLGILPILGRSITPEDDVPEAPRVVMLGYDLWQNRFGGDPTLIGTTLHLDDEPFEIIGVLPQAALFVGDADLWTAFRFDVDTYPYNWSYTGVGRLKDGVTIEQAQQDLERIHKNQIETRDVNEITYPTVEPILERFLGEFRLGTTALLGAVGLVLLIACANIAGLMLARSLARGREMGIRVAIGAGRGRIVRQILTESLVLASVGGVFGAFLGYWGFRIIAVSMPEDLPRWISFQLDARGILFTFGLMVAAAVLAGLAPALRASRTDPGAALQDATHRATSSGGRRRVLSALVVGEVALALTLLIVAGLSMRDFQAVRDIDPGFRAEGVLTYRVDLSGSAYDEPEARLQFFEGYLERLRALPGVQTAAVANFTPLAGHWGKGIEIENAPPRDPDEPTPIILMRVVSPGYFQAMGVTLRSGRGFTDADGRDEGTEVAIVNETFVRRFFPEGNDPIGQRIRFNVGDSWKTVVGVGRDVKHYGQDEEMRPGIYVPLAFEPLWSGAFVIRTPLDPVSLVPQARSVLQGLAPALPTYDVTTMSERVSESLWPRRASSWLFAVFSSLALLLAVGGIYGVISYGVNQRAFELSIRMALGAEGGQVLRLVLGQGMILVGIGTAIGLAGAYGAARGLSAMFFGVNAIDPVIYSRVTILLLGVAVIANLVPAFRASRTDPMQSLRDG
ncbi:ABC transporter permease [Gemmatimonadota bacterium]